MAVLQASRSLDVTKNPMKVAGAILAGNLALMMEIRKRIVIFRDALDLPPCDYSGSIIQIIMRTAEDLHNLYSIKIPNIEIPNTQDSSVYEGLARLNIALSHAASFWAKTHKWAAADPLPQDDVVITLQNINLDQMSERVLGKLDFMTEVAKQLPDKMDEDDRNPAEIDDVPSSLPLLLPLRLQALGKLNPISLSTLTGATSNAMKGADEEKETARNGGKTAAAPTPPPLPAIALPTLRPQPPPPPMPDLAATKAPPVLTAPPPPPVPGAKGGVPPPPPPLAAGSMPPLRAKKANTKLKRSSHMGTLYRVLKGKVEGRAVDGKHSPTAGKGNSVGGCGGGKRGMADALAEMTKRSAYFQQIEEDVKKHEKSIMEMKSAIESFQNKDMRELLTFHKHMERQLEELTDETQVLARFEGFPAKKLEALRTAAALYCKFEAHHANLENWKMAPPLNQLLEKIESYYNKIKGEIESLERNKEEESKRFQSCKIQFDFTILMRIKESMVDVSSSCMELALKERREAMGSKGDARRRACVKMLWRAFQLAFRTYSFAGGHDDRADRLSQELAQQIEMEPHPQN